MTHGQLAGQEPVVRYWYTLLFTPMYTEVTSVSDAMSGPMTLTRSVAVRDASPPVLLEFLRSSTGDGVTGRKVSRGKRRSNMCILAV
ncbi:MAG TPA: hypothetical protein VGL48_16625 [Acidimicrobiales bacterium]|jgi:hypothetical protein